ncbi:MAG: F0F1 ATP synthase subunit B' [Reyranellaceae bacterium]
MPQFDVTSFPSQIFWLVVTFVVMYFVMAKLVLPRVGTVLQDRQEKIAEDLDRAGQLKKDAEEITATYEAALAEARAKAQALHRETADALAAAATKRQHEAGAAVAARIAEAEQRIAAARTEAMGQIKSVAADVAAAAIAKVAGVSVDGGRLSGEIDSVIGARR